MRADQVERVARAIERGYGIVAGDYVVYVAPNGVETGLLTIMEDRYIYTADGLEIDAAGLRSGNERELLFLTSYLDAQSVVLDPAGYFKINGERWDFADDEPVQSAIVPIAGIHNLVNVRIRKAVELKQTTGGASWGYRL